MTPAPSVILRRLSVAIGVRCAALACIPAITLLVEREVRSTAALVGLGAICAFAGAVLLRGILGHVAAAHYLGWRGGVEAAIEARHEVEADLAGAKVDVRERYVQ